MAAANWPRHAPASRPLAHKLGGLGYVSVNLCGLRVKALVQQTVADEF